MSATENPNLIADLGALQSATRELLAQARLSVEILSPDLEQRLYDDAEILSSLRALVVGQRRARIRVLARELDAAVRGDHRLIALARRLSSYIEIRRLSEEDLLLNEAFLIVDREAFIRRPAGDRPEGELHTHAPLLARELSKRFDELWERAILDPNLRRPHL